MDTRAPTIANQATRIRLSDFRSAPMRAFHITWISFFTAFFGWFGIAPLMPIVRDELSLTKTQVGNTIVASVAVTILVRLLIGWICDRVGPRKAYTALLVVGSIPVMTIGLASTYESFLLFRLAIGAIGASFVITQYHTSLMFAPNVVGTANATTAGWGNLGGGVTQMVMPLVLAAVVSLGVGEYWGWRLAMVIPGVMLLLCGVAYWFLTQDLPDGNFDELRAQGKLPEMKKSASFWEAAKDYRVWALFIVYAACFGVELTINNIAALYYVDQFGLGIATAGLVAGLFGLMNIFARTLGGVVSDRFNLSFGLRGRVLFLFCVLMLEGFALMLFSRMSILPIAIASMIVFSLFVQMSEGATYAVVPFINKRALGSVSGIVGAGGNAGAVAAGFLFRAEGLSTQSALLYLGMCVAGASVFALLVQFAPETQREARLATEAAQAARRGGVAPALAE